MRWWTRWPTFSGANCCLRCWGHNPQDDAPVVVAGSDRDADVVERLVTMNHVHLPKLADLGFIEWDSERHEVKKGPNFDEIRPLLELLDNHKDELPDAWV